MDTEAETAAIETLIANRGGRGTTSDAALVDWIYRKLALYLQPCSDSRPMDQQIMGWIHVACHGHKEIDFYASEYSRICRERDDLKIRLQHRTDARDADWKTMRKMEAHIKNLEARLSEANGKVLLAELKRPEGDDDRSIHKNKL